MASMIESKVEELKDPNEKPVNREKTCPLLLRVFLSTGRHSNILEYRRSNVPANELQIYTWMDATLREICSLVQEVNSDAKRRGTGFEFSLVVPEFNKRPPNMREIGTVIEGMKGFDDNKTLATLGFTIGDFLDIAIINPNQRPQPRRMRPYYEGKGGYKEHL